MCSKIQTGERNSVAMKGLVSSDAASVGKLSTKIWFYQTSLQRLINQRKKDL